MPQVWSHPAVRAVKVWPPATATGEYSVAWSSLPSPRTPKPSMPQHHAWPVVSSPQLWTQPALMVFGLIFGSGSVSVSVSGWVWGSGSAVVVPGPGT